MDMLNSCSHALSQGDGNDFHPGCNWGQLLLVTVPACESLDMIGSTPWPTPAWTYYDSPVKLEEYWNAGRCNWLWEESEMVLQRKIGAGI